MLKEYTVREWCKHLKSINWSVKSQQGGEQTSGPENQGCIAAIGVFHKTSFECKGSKPVSHM